MTDTPLRHATLLVALLAYLWTGARPAMSEVVRVRGGEHDTFTRIVLDLDKPAEWQLGRSKTGYEFRLFQPDAAFDLDDAFRVIPRTRVADIVALPRQGHLGFTVNCACYARAFTTGTNTIVIDFRNGTAPVDSPFEDILSAPRNLFAGPELPGFPSPWGSPGLPDDLNRVLRERLAAHHPTRQEEEPLWQIPATDPHLDHSKRNALAPWIWPLTAPLPDSEFGARTLMPLPPDPRVSEAEAQIILQLGRAASQGLVDIDPTNSQPASRLPEPESRKETGTPSAAPQAPGPLAHVETSVDRDTLGFPQQMIVTSDGYACLPDADFNFGQWGDNRPAAEQISELRRNLVGEFDRPFEESVLALARLYIFFGFGAESRSVLKAFQIEDESVPLLMDLASILDNDASAAPTQLAGMTDCDTAAALWALLATSDPVPGAEINQRAVLQAFSALPLHLRKALGPVLSAKLVSIGAPDAAVAIRNTLARAPDATGPELNMIDARLSLAQGDTLVGEALLDQIALSNHSSSAEALLLTIRSRLNRGEPVADRLAEIAGALAYELRDEDLGPELQQANILALASSHNFSLAFAALRRWASDVPDPIKIETSRQLWTGLAEHAGDAEFLGEVYAEPDIRLAIGQNDVLQTTLSQRLVQLGLTRKARELLQGDVAKSGGAQMLLAEAALAEFDPTAALTYLANLESPESEGMRARALAMSGQHAASALAYSDAGDKDAAGAEAWRAGNLAMASQQGPAPMRQALADLELTDDASSTDLGATTVTDKPSHGMDTSIAAQGELAAGLMLVERSRKSRAALAALLISAGDPLSQE